MSASTIPQVLARLRQAHPNARYELDWNTPEELLVATILAAQCTDERVNRVTPELFRKYPSPRHFAQANREELEEAIRPTGYYRQKAKSIQGACKELCDRFGGVLPRSMDELITLPGVARKTANVVLNTAFDLPSGIIVDTHVERVAPRMGLTREQGAEAIEQDLMRSVPREQWTFFGPAMVLHGRYTCTAKAPRCSACPMEEFCPKIGVEAEGAGADREEVEVEVEKPVGERKKKAEKRKPAKAKAEEPEESWAPPRPAKGPGGPLESPVIGGLEEAIPEGWRELLADEFHKPYWRALEEFVREERRTQTVFPPEAEVFSALALTPYEQVSVVLLGQDPYHDHGQAHGLCFSVKPGVKPPPSLVNMYKELKSDLGLAIPRHGCLTHWAEQGMLMLNAVLTVRAHTPNSHKDKGWETFTDAVLRKVNEKPDRVVFVLWGSYAQKKAKLLDAGRHTILKGTHPSPLSASNGFFGSRPYSAINEALREAGQPEIDWSLPEP